jgi:hypothetical protein
MRPYRPVAVATATLSLAFLLGGCGLFGGDDAQDGGSSSAVSLTEQTPEQLLKASAKAVKAARSVHVRGQLTDDGQTTKIDMVMAPGGQAQGRIIIGKQTLSLRRISGSLYAQGNPAFWTAQGFDAFAGQLTGKWLKAPANESAFRQFAPLTDPVTFFDGILQPASGASLAVVPGVASGGVNTVGIEDQGAAGGTLYLADDAAKPVPMALRPGRGAAAATDRMTFSEWDAAVTVQAPPAAQVVDSSELT